MRFLALEHARSGVLRDAPIVIYRPSHLAVDDKNSRLVDAINPTGRPLSLIRRFKPNDELRAGALHIVECLTWEQIESLISQGGVVLDFNALAGDIAMETLEKEGKIGDPQETRADQCRRVGEEWEGHYPEADHPDDLDRAANRIGFASYEALEELASAGRAYLEMLTGGLPDSEELEVDFKEVLVSRLSRALDDLDLESAACLLSGIKAIEAGDMCELQDVFSGWEPEADSALSGYQDRVAQWALDCFGPEVTSCHLERGDRLLEEVFELLQSCGYPKDRVATLEKYTWSRIAGLPTQEVGGVMVTLAAFCSAHDLDMITCGERELERVWENVEEIRAKQAAKPSGSPLPQAWPAASADGKVRPGSVRHDC
ncbi:hypothetical protein [Chachezhania antarctica]|uniref:hypothetical protein n=1 Tax=Chachezhania antarctica TaxID=2340860 RepID=UPI0019694C2D|nr:hypothetical protein [Chachezhania antarctica]